MPSTRTLIFAGLNAVRFLSIVALILLFASSIKALVTDIEAVNAFVALGKPTGNSTDAECDQYDSEYVPGSTVPNQPAGAFWAVLNRLLIMTQAVVIMFSELGWPAVFFNKYFPVLGDGFGLGALGIMQSLLGASVLSHYVDEFSLFSGFFVFSIGCLNMLLGLIWRESAKERRSIRKWRQPEDEDVLAARNLRASPQLRQLHTGTSGSATWVDAEKQMGYAGRSDSMTSSRSGMGFGRQGEKAALARGATLTVPREALPTYAPRPTARASEHDSESRPVSMS